MPANASMLCWPACMTQNKWDFDCNAGVGQVGLGALASNAGKRLWMSEYSSGDYDVTDIRSGLQLSMQVCGQTHVQESSARSCA